MKTKVQFYLSVLTTVALFVIPTMAHAAPPSPFIGHWQAIDVDGSDMTLSIAGPPDGAFQITWTDNFISFCNGEAGIIRGTGWLNEGNSNLLEADLHLACFTTGATLDFHLTFRYHPATNTLSTRYSFGPVTIWNRPGAPQPPPPALGLRVNYGHDWVESFYEAGHTVWITVTESDGETVKATAEVFTEPQDFWGGETGFHTQPEDWDPSPPDIQPHDWVYGWVDNGASAQVQIGDITGMIDFEADSIAGTISALWFYDEVNVECFPWGAPEPQPEMEYDIILPDGNDTYSCSWEDEWNIQLGQDVGVGYVGPDGHWVANAFVTNARFVASANGDWLWTTDFSPSASLTVSIYASKDPGAGPLWEGSKTTDEWGFARVEPSDHSLDLEPGNYLTVSDGIARKGLVLEAITMDIFDVDQDLMAGTAPAGRDVWAAAGPQDSQDGIWVIADSESGAWIADLTEVVDITEEMRPWSYAQIFDDDGDVNEANPPPPPLDLRVNYGHDWVESFYEAGHTVWITVTESDGETVKATAEVFTEPQDFWGGETGFHTQPEDWDPSPPDIQPHDWVFGWVDNGASAQVQIGDISGMIDLEADSIAGTISAPWFFDEVNVECFPWGAPEPQPEMKFDDILPDGEDMYSCSWVGEWDIQPGQDVGVGYFGPDGHWVANAFQEAIYWAAAFTH